MSTERPNSILLHTEPGGSYVIWAVFAHHRVSVASVPGHVSLELVRKIARLFALDAGLASFEED